MTMDITCSKCGSEYSLDDTLISSSGTSVRCTNCNQVFKVYKTSGRKRDEWVVRQVHGPMRTFDSLKDLKKWIQDGKSSTQDLLSKNNGQWKKLGDIVEFKLFFDAAEKNSAPAEGRFRQAPSEFEQTLKRKPSKTEEWDHTEKIALLKDTNPNAETIGDKASSFPVKSSLPTNKNLSGNTETKRTTLPPPAPISIGNLNDDEEITQTFNKNGSEISTLATPTSTSKTKRSDSVELSGSHNNKSDNSVPNSNITDFASIPTSKTEDIAWGNDNSSSTPNDPEWTEKESSLPLYDDGKPDRTNLSYKSNSKWIIIGAVVVAIFIAALVFFANPQQGNELLTTVEDMVSRQDQDRFMDFFHRGQEFFLLDTEDHFLQADREFQKVLALKENDAATLAALSRLYSVWAQYYRDAKTDVQTDAATKRVDTSAADKEIQNLNRKFEAKLKESVQWSRQAQIYNPDLKEVLLASADVARLNGDLEDARSILARAEAIGIDEETQYLSILIDMDKGSPPIQLADKLEKALSAKSIIRAIYRIARLRAAGEQTDLATKAMDKLFSLNSEHYWAKELKARIDSKQPVYLTANVLRANLSTENRNSEPVAKAEHQEPSSNKVEPASTLQDKSQQSTSALMKRAAALRNSGQAGQAISVYDSVLDREPSNVDAHTGIGYCHLDKGETGKALASFRRALTVNPSYGPAVMGTAETYKVMGNREEALKYYKQYLSTNPSGSQSAAAKKNIERLQGDAERQNEEKENRLSDSENNEKRTDETSKLQEEKEVRETIKISEEPVVPNNNIPAEEQSENTKKSDTPALSEE